MLQLAIVSTPLYINLRVVAVCAYVSLIDLSLIHTSYNCIYPYWENIACFRKVNCY
jgi:hypothetical protein